MSNNSISFIFDIYDNNLICYYCQKPFVILNVRTHYIVTQRRCDVTNALHKNTGHWIREFCSWLKCKNGVFAHKYVRPVMTSISLEQWAGKTYGRGHARENPAYKTIQPPPPSPLNSFIASYKKCNVINHIRSAGNVKE